MMLTRLLRSLCRPFRRGYITHWSYDMTLYDSGDGYGIVGARGILLASRKG